MPCGNSGTHSRVDLRVELGCMDRPAGFLDPFDLELFKDNSVYLL